MELKLVQEKIAKALNNVSRVAAGGRATLPILSNVLIKVVNKEVSLTTTNLDMAVTSRIIAKEGQDGSITVPARLIAEFVGNLPRGEDVTIKVDNEKVLIGSKGYKSTINGAAAEDFPELPDIEHELAKFTIAADKFKTGLGQVMVAASNDMTRPALTGICFNTVDGGLFVAATDGYRLAERKLVDNVENELNAIVPASSLQEVLRSLGDDTDDIEVIFDETGVKFIIGDIEIISKLIDGSFPDYRQLIPESSEINVELKKDELVRVTKLAALFAKEVGGSIVCETNSEKSVFSIASVANELGENTSEIETAVENNGRVVLNSRFLLDVLNVLEGKEISFGFANRLDPVVIRGKENQDYVHIIMPLKG